MAKKRKSNFLLIVLLVLFCLLAVGLFSSQLISVPSTASPSDKPSSDSSGSAAEISILVDCGNCVFNS